MDRDRVGVDLLDTIDVVATGARAGEVERTEGGARLRRQPLKIPDRGVGIPIAAVVELDVVAQLDDPLLEIAGIGGPLGCQRGLDVGFPIAARQIPIDEGLGM